MTDKENNRYSLNHIDFLINGQYISDSKTIANYFINMVSSLASRIKSEKRPTTIIFKLIINLFIFPKLTIKFEIESIISSINNSSSCYYELPASIMKQCTGSYIDPLILVINQSITQGVFPAELKIARVVPLYKGDNNQVKHNYRSIYVLQFFSKSYLYIYK